MKRVPALLLLVLLVSGTALAEDPVYFADANLEAAVEEKLGVTDPTPTDMLALTTLTARVKGIVDMTGLEYAVNITLLDLSYNDINDASVPVVSDLTNLIILNLSQNDISDLSPLSGLTNLTTLYLWKDKISDISALSGLTNLTELIVGFNQITDINAVSGLTNLKKLALYRNQISDISPVAGLVNLEDLALDDNQITDCNAVAGLTNLLLLNLTKNQISDCNAIGGLVNVANLYLQENQIVGVSALSGLTKLSTLKLNDNQIVDITGLAGLVKLRTLNLNNNQISRIAALAEMTNLWTLDLQSNPLGTSAYCYYLPLIEENNPLWNSFDYDPNPDPPAGDITGECYVDIADFALFANQWSKSGCGECGGADFDGDSNVDGNDLSILVDNWLDTGPEGFYENHLDGDPCWTTEGEWAFGRPGGAGGDSYGGPDPEYGGPGANVYGVNLAGDYNTVVGGPYYMTAGPFDCNDHNDIFLQFARWLNTDEPGYVESTIEVSNDGGSWAPAWEHTERSPITDGDWQIVQYDISETADNQPMVYIRWGYEILDEAWPYSGWNIDEIILW